MRQLGVGGEFGRGCHWFLLENDQKKAAGKGPLGSEDSEPLDFEFSWGDGEAPGKHIMRLSRRKTPVAGDFSEPQLHTEDTNGSYRTLVCAPSQGTYTGARCGLCTAMMTPLRQPWEASKCSNPISRVGTQRRDFPRLPVILWWSAREPGTFLFTLSVKEGEEKMSCTHICVQWLGVVRGCKA